MKIYTRVVISMATGAVIEEESYEYDGPLALCGGGGSDVEAPQPTSTELAIQGEQLAALRKSNALYDAFLPYALNEYGYVQNTLTPEQQTTYNGLKQQYNEANQVYERYKGIKGGMGTPEFQNAVSQMQGLTDQMKQYKTPGYRKLSDEEIYNNMSDLEKLQYDASKLQSERTIKALKGELDISPALEKSLSDQEMALRNLLSQKLGADYELSTPGQNALKAFTEKADLVREEARRGEISQGTGLMLAQQGYYDTANSNNASNYLGLSQSALPNANAYNSILQPYQQQRQMQYSADAANAGASAQRSSGLMGGIGSLVGTAGGLIAMGMMSDIRLKHNVVYL